MAERALEKTVKQLKQERTLAKTTFLERANHLARAVGRLVKRELLEEFSNLRFLAEKVNEANLKYRAGLLVHFEEEEYDYDGDEFDYLQQADLEKTIEECEAKLDEVQIVVKTKLWQRYGEAEMNYAIQEAERACDRAFACCITAINRGGYEMHLKEAKRLIQEAVTSLTDWETWIPHDKIGEMEGRVKNLKSSGNNLVARKADFLTAQRIAEESRKVESKPLELPAAVFPKCW